MQLAEGQRVLGDEGAEAVSVQLGDAVVGRLPGMGVSATPGHQHDEVEIEALRRLELTYLRAMLKMEPGWEQVLACAANAAVSLGVGLELEVVVSGGAMVLVRRGLAPRQHASLGGS